MDTEAIRKSLISKFREVTSDRLEKIGVALLELERDPSSVAAPEDVARELHTMKGEARMLSMPRIGELAHGCEDLLKANRMAGTLHFELSASLPYDKIVHATLTSIAEHPMDSYRPISDYVLGGITGVAEGYQQLLRRIDTLRGGFEGIIAIIRTRIDLILEGQNLALLQSVDKTTKSQVLLQNTVEGLSVIVIAYYLAGLVGYVFKGLSELGWLGNANLASAIFVPVAIGLAFAITTVSKKYLHKKLATEQPSAKRDKTEE